MCLPARGERSRCERSRWERRSRRERRSWERRWKKGGTEGGGQLTMAEAHANHAAYSADAAGRDEPPGAVLVKYGANVHAAEEGQEGVYGEDPANGALAIVAKLVTERVSLEYANRVH
jgi:hypothetical protein